MNILKRINTYPKIILVSVCIIFFTGILPSIILNEWLWFSRSGSLLTIFGILIVWLDYKGDINNDLNLVFSGFQDYLKEQNELDEKQKVKIENEIRDKFNEVNRRTIKRFKSIEFLIIGMGTLIWGYGDLINNIFR
jgi:hypothetical protein